MKKRKIETIEDWRRDKTLWKDDAEIAERIVKWFGLLISLRRAADGGVPSQDLIEQLLRADPDVLEHDEMWLMDFLADRFQLKQEKINQTKPQKIGQASYIKVWKASTTKSVNDIAKRHGVSRATVRDFQEKNPWTKLISK
ncbi:MAG: hypothetical protein O7G31_06600 [Calditrichaeota bacterium]|nr:hypothetical protein [Calditrichota bacterium]